MKVREGATFVSGEHVTGLRPSICPALLLPPATLTLLTSLLCFCNNLLAIPQAPLVSPLLLVPAIRTSSAPLIMHRQSFPSLQTRLDKSLKAHALTKILLSTVEHPQPRQAFPSSHFTLRHSARRPLPSHLILTSSITAHTTLLNPRPSS